MNYSIEVYKDRFNCSSFDIYGYTEREGTLQDMVTDFNDVVCPFGGKVIVREIPEIFEESRYMFSKIRIADGRILKYDYRYGRRFRFSDC